MLNCKQKIKHLKAYPDHKQHLLTSTQYASENKICELANGYNKLIKKSDGEEFMISPFAPIHLPTLNKEHIRLEVGDDSSESQIAESQIRGEPFIKSKAQKRLLDSESMENPELYKTRND